MAQPLDSEMLIDQFETAIDKVLSSNGLTLSARQSIVVTADFDNALSFYVYVKNGSQSRRISIGHGVTCLFCGDDDLLGILHLNRLADDAEFSQHDLLVLNALQPHITHKLMQELHNRNATPFDAMALQADYGLTTRETEVASCVAYGMTPAEIGVKLSISPRTAKKHLESIYRKAGVKNRLSLMRLILQYASL